MLLFNPLSLCKVPTEFLMGKMSGSTFRTKGNVTNTGTELIAFNNMFRDLYYVTELLSKKGRIPDMGGGGRGGEPGQAPPTGGWGTKALPPSCRGRKWES